VKNAILNCEAVAERGLVERYVAGRLNDNQDRGALEAHLLTCELCQEEVRIALIVRAEVAAGESGPAGPALKLPEREGRDAPRRLPRGFLVGLATAAALVLVFQRQAAWLGRSNGAHRGATQAPALAPVLRQPTGQVSTVPRMQWSGFAGAQRYRVRLFNADGDVLWEAQGTDTTVALPESVHLTAGRRYYWSVAGRVDVDRWVESALTDFVIGPTGRQ